MPGFLYNNKIGQAKRKVILNAMKEMEGLLPNSKDKNK